MNKKQAKQTIISVVKQRWIVILLIILQLTLYVGVIWLWTKDAAIPGLIMTMVSWGLAMYVAASQRHPSYKIRWIIIVLVAPLVGGAIFLLFDTDYIVRDLKKQVNNNTEKLNAWRADDQDALKHFTREAPSRGRVARYLSMHSKFPIFEGNTTQFLSIGEAFWEALLKDVRQARHFIFMEFFIIERGVMLDTLLDALEERAKAGVEVRFMYDDLGSLVKVSNDFPQYLETRGIHCRKFNPLRPALTASLNNRDHRKIVVIDGDIAYTGGVNLADEYINAIVKFGHWKDAGIRVVGTASWSFTLMFLGLWKQPGDPDEDYRLWMPTTTVIEQEGEPGYVQPFGDSPFDDELVSDTAMLSIITQAKRYIYITTPYLIVDYNIQSALEVAAKSGVDVRIITPHHWDKRMVHMTTRTYYRPLIQSGVKIYEYTPGFIHSKTLITDDKLAVVGTVNFDYRSLYLHFECGLILYGTPSLVAVKEDFENVEKVSQTVTLEDCPKGIVKRLAGEVLKIFAPLM